jgi:hypothetical protein
MDHCFYKCCGLSFNFHNKCHILGSCLSTVIKTTHPFSHFTLYIKGPVILFVVAGMQNRVSTAPCFCSSSVGRGEETIV